MKILTGEYIRGADRATIEREPVESLALMERAAEVLAQAIAERVEQGSELVFFVGKGNNGGDGLAVARMLSQVGYYCTAIMAGGTEMLSDDCRANFERLPAAVKIASDSFEISDDAIIIDAMLGSGVDGEVRGPIADAIACINDLPNRVIAIDVPSGMRTEFGNDPCRIVHADTTLTIQFPKLAMMLPEAGDCCGEIVVLSIELDQEYLENAPSPYYCTGLEDVAEMVAPLRKFAHKGDLGHALLVCGSQGMAGAAILSTCAALRSGCGLVTTHLPATEAFALHASAPSAMVSIDSASCFSQVPDEIDKYSAVGVGCGLDQRSETVEALRSLFSTCRKPMAIDADALNIIALDHELRELIPIGSILTPHPGEFRRLVGNWSGEAEKLQKLQEFATASECVIVLKGAHTAVCVPDGRIFFNMTGTPGMAKGGSGDILTGLLSGLLAQGYPAEAAARIGVWLHGRAGEKAADYFGPRGMNSADMIDFLPEAWTEIG
ncbi:NAD(P)H-hydrate dehydratase [Alistipes sp. OttesenSCG-928-B03]|nr:NAD(P)H-hydrate dehydratase [Alistipes sp. OttesenSCG-928-B03]